MAINKVQTQSGEVLIDLTGDTATAADIVSGKTAHDKSGALITGTYSPETLLDTATIYPDTKVVSKGPDEGYIGFSHVYVQPVTASIDSNIKPENIKYGVTILGVVGTLGQPEGYTVEISNIYSTNSVAVYDGQDKSGTYLGDATSSTASSFNCTSGYLYLDGPVGYYPVNVTINSGSITVQSSGDGYALLKVDSDGSIEVENQCIVEGTQITLSDGTTKAIEDITYDDELLTWNFDEGKFEARKPCWIMKPGSCQKYWHVTLSDGTEIDLVGSRNKSHRFLNIEQGKFTYANDFIGEERTFKQDGTTPYVVSCEPITDKTVNYYNLITEHNINCFANGIMVGDRFSNMYEIKDMKFVKTDKPLNKREDYPEVPDRIFYGLRVAEQNEQENSGASVQFFDTLKEHIIHNIVEHDILHTGKSDYVPWLFKRKKEPR